MSYDENRISDLIDGGIHERERQEKIIHEIIKEAPMGYGVMVLFDYRSDKKSADTLLEE